MNSFFFSGQRLRYAMLCYANKSQTGSQQSLTFLMVVFKKSLLDDIANANDRDKAQNTVDGSVSLAATIDRNRSLDHAFRRRVVVVVRFLQGGCLCE